MNRGVPGQQPLRATPGNVFVNQQQPAARTTPLGSSRLQNAKIGASHDGMNDQHGDRLTQHHHPAGSSTAGWSGMGLGSAMQQPRPGNVGMSSSFAATIGGSGSQSQTPLDLSEFPSLSGAPQQQPQPSSATTSQAPWSVGGSRSGTQGPQVRSTQGLVSRTSAPGAPTQGQQQRLDAARDSNTSPFPPMTAGEYRMQRQQASTEDFPRSGGGLDGVDAASVRKVGTDGGSGPDTLDDLGAATQRHDTSIMTRGPGRSNTNPFGQPPSSLPFAASQNGTHTSGFAASTDASGTQNSQTQMSELDRWGLAGLLETLRGPHQDQTAIALGMDLNSLGLNLNRPNDQPLHVDWAGPFADPGRPVVPEFRLPETYNVRNVPPLESKIQSFSDETLFAIFYQFPRDVKQELAANELYQRDWRWHKKLQQWMMKAKELGEPQVLASMKEERGFYYFFDANNWRRERKEFILNYEHLYHHNHQTMQAMQQPPL